MRNETGRKEMMEKMITSTGRMMRGFLAVVIAVCVLGSGITAAAVDKPSQASNPTWGDVWQLGEYVDQEVYSLERSGELEFVDGTPSAEAAYYQSGKKLADCNDEEGFASVYETYFDGKDSNVEETTELTGDQSAHYSDLYDKGIKMCNNVATATGEKYIGDLESSLESINDKIGTIGELDDAGKIIYVDTDTGDTPPDTAQMSKGTYWAYASDMNAFWQACETQGRIQDSWNWEGHNGGPAISRAEMQGVISALQSAYDTLLPGLHEGEIGTADSSSSTKKSKKSKKVKTEVISETAEAVETEQPEQEEKPVLVNQVVASDGGKTESSINGVYEKTSVCGVVHTDAKEKIEQSAGLSKEETAGGAVVRYYICMSRNKSVNDKLFKEVSAQGYRVLEIINSDLYKIYKGEVTKIKTTQEQLTVMLGVPESLRAGDYEFAVICYDEAGKPVVIKDIDTDKNTVTVQTANFGYWAIGYKEKSK